MNTPIHAGKLRSCLFALLILAAGAAQAQLFRAYVSKDGSDANPCTLAAPCRLLPAALTAVADGGEIWMLDSANFNTTTVTIGKSVSILAVPGVVGSVVSVASYAIRIPTSSLKVALRNLVIVPLPAGGGANGVWLEGDSVLTVENSLFANLPQYGIIVTAGKLRLTNSTLRGSETAAGLLVQASATADVSGSQFLDNALGGIVVSQGTAATASVNVSDSIFSGNPLAGVQTFASVSGAVARAMVTRSSFQSNGTGLQCVTSSASASAIIACSYCMIAGNATGYQQSGTGSVIRTLGNNHITDNGTNVGALTLTALQ